MNIDTKIVASPEPSTHADSNQRMISKKLSNKVAVITGAARGIGSAIAKRFAAEGAVVVINYASRKEDAERTMAAIQAKGGVAITFQADITKASAVEQLFTAANERFGRIDILVNNAALDDFVPLNQITEEHFHSHFEVNVLGMLLAVKEAVKYMEKNNGCILNISSLSSTHPAAGSVVYGGSKAAVDAITATLALELGPNGIRINAINPGMVKTEGLDELSFITPEFRNHIAAMTPLCRLGEPEDIAAAAVLFCSGDAHWITGQCIRVSGG
jgi:3-oxoacyl-[acyl-carrier protein] reductase